MKLCMIGTGYVGLVSGVCFSDLGNTVYCVDKDENKINSLNRGIIPIYEPGLEEILKKNYKQKRLFFTTNLKKAVNNSDIIFICVGTPNKKNSNSANLKYVFNVANDDKVFGQLVVNIPLVKKIIFLFSKFLRMQSLLVGIAKIK